MEKIIHRSGKKMNKNKKLKIMYIERQKINELLARGTLYLKDDNVYIQTGI